MTRTLQAIAFLLLLGCTAAICPPHADDPHQRCTEGVPNLLHVDATVYRGGQPTLDGWQHLHALGVTTVVKLNAASESDGYGDDAPATALGMQVIEVTMHPLGGDDPLELLRGPTLDQAAMAVAALSTTHGTLYVHCSHGRDRTGLIIALYRVFIDGWAPHHARQEMLDAGFRVVNLGLDHVWEELFTSEHAAERQAEFRADLERAAARLNGH